MYHKSADEKQLLLKLMGEVYDNPFWSLGEKTKEAERLCKTRVFNEQKNVLLVNDGTHALELCLRDIGVEGKYVMLPVMTVPMVGWAIQQAGGIPLFADVDDSLQLDYDSVHNLYAEHGNDVAAVIIVHTGGLISNRIFEFMTFCRERSLPLIEDISHAQCSYIELHDAEFREKNFLPRINYAGNFGDYAAFSMYATKVISTGEGGFAAKRGDILGMRTLRNQGKNEKQQWCRKGYNFRPSEWTACVAIAKLTFLEKELQHRRTLAGLYDDAGVQGLHKDTYYGWNNLKMVPSFYKYIIRRHMNLEEKLSYKTGAVHRDLLDMPLDYYKGADYASRNHVCLDLRNLEVVNTTIDELKDLGVI